MTDNPTKDKTLLWRTRKLLGVMLAGKEPDLQELNALHSEICNSAAPDLAQEAKIRQAVDNGLEQILIDVQTLHGIKDGDVAALYFQGGKWETLRRELVATYVLYVHYEDLYNGE